AAAALAAIGDAHAHAVAFRQQRLDPATFLDQAAALAHHPRQFGDVAVRTQVRVVGETDRTNHALAQRRLVAQVGTAVDHLGRDTHAVERRALGHVVFEVAAVAEHVVQAGLAELAVQAVAAYPVL